MATYGKIHQVSDFILRTLPRRDAPFAHKVIGLLAALDKAQQTNPGVTLGVQSGGGLRILYKGESIALIIPSHKHLRIFSIDRSLKSFLNECVIKRHAVYQKIDTKKNKYEYWRIGETAILGLGKLILQLPKLKDDEMSFYGDHPRSFPGHLREAAYQEFIKSGSVCAGVHRPAHKLGGNERIVFDHILPYSNRGASSDWNIQVLCTDCNLKKRDTAFGNAAISRLAERRRHKEVREGQC